MICLKKSQNATKTFFQLASLSVIFDEKSFSRKCYFILDAHIL